MRAREIPVIDGQPHFACSRCKVEKPLTSEHFHANSTTRHGFSFYCKPCDHESATISRAKNRENYNAYQASYQRLRRLGVTREQYDEMVRQQEGRCAICGRTPTRKVLAVDHDHATGKIRELLCSDCNLGIGNLADSPERLEAAAAYLRKHA